MRFALAAVAAATLGAATHVAPPVAARRGHGHRSPSSPAPVPAMPPPAFVPTP